MTERMTAAEYRALAKRSRSKYRAEKVVIDGIRFDSKAEARRYGELKLLEKAGEIVGLDVHPRYAIPVGEGVRADLIQYTADFAYERDGQYVVEDVKGVVTADATLRIRLMRAVLGIEVKIIGGKR